MRNGRSLRLVLAAMVATVVLPLLAVTPASAAVDPSAPVWYVVDVTGVTKTTNVTRYDMVLGRCGGSTTPITCSISSGKTATRTIGVAFGISAVGVSASLGISSSRAVTITSSCSGVTRPPTYSFINGYAYGDTYRYTVRQRKYEYGRLTQTQTSVQYAFNPTGIRCALAS